MSKDKGFGGYDLWTEVNGKWSVSPDALDWNTNMPVKPGAMLKLGFTIAAGEEGGFELSYVLRRDPIWEPFATIEDAMKRADEIAKEILK